MREWLRTSRIEKKLTQEEMSMQLGISESYYCMIERGERQKRMDITLIKGIAAALSVSIDFIIQSESANQAS